MMCEPRPGPNGEKRWVEEFAEELYHQLQDCKLGPPNDCCANCLRREVEANWEVSGECYIYPPGRRRCLCLGAHAATSCVRYGTCPVGTTALQGLDYCPGETAGEGGGQEQF